MKTKVLQVFYGADALPYKDKERTVHFPIVGNAIQNANNTTQIKFYFDRLIEENEQTTFVAVSKLPNGKIGSKILETYDDEELCEQYALLDLDSFYTQYKGDVFISLQCYQGGVRVEQDEQGIYQIYGTPVIAATGSIKLVINYAPSFVGSGETENVTLQQVLGELSTKLGVRQETFHVEELPIVGNPDIWYVVNDDEDDPNKQNIYIWNATTQTYVWVGDNTLNLGNYYTTEQGQEFEEEIDQRITNVENTFNGSPKGVYATLEDLQTAYPTGTTGIYVVSGGTYAGHWYYWNGSAWTDGGVYQATAISESDPVIQNIENKISTLPILGNAFNHACIKSIEFINCPPNIDVYFQYLYRRRYDSDNDDANAVRMFFIVDSSANILFAWSAQNATHNQYPLTLETIECDVFPNSPYKDQYPNAKLKMIVDWTKAPKDAAEGTFTIDNNSKIAPQVYNAHKDYKLSRWYGKNVMVLGDSISTDAYLGFQSWATHLANKMGFNLLNPSSHATGYLCGTGQTEPDSQSLIYLIEYMHTQVPNKDDLDLIIFFRGTNDYTYNEPLGNGTEEFNQSFTSAVQYCFAKALQYWSHARIVVFTPLQRLDQIYDVTPPVFKDYVDVIKEKAEYMSYPLLDLYSKAGFYLAKRAFNTVITTDGQESGNTQFDLDYNMLYQGTPDGIHPNEKFTRERLEPLIENFLEYMI